MAVAPENTAAEQTAVGIDPVIQVVPLGAPWPTLDPFLFCMHHHDAYPAGNETFGPQASLAGRDIGQDFAGIDGWNMYHGSNVPGFPPHPHRGFETVTYVTTGLIDHSDSIGAAARFGRGDVQWLTAGRGIVHSEMFPLLDPAGPNPLELFQIWLNLPRDDKMVDPYFTMFWSRDVPTIEVADAEGRSVTITVVAGELDGQRPPPPPPNSWAARPDSDVAIWHLHLEPNATWDLPAAASAQTVRTLYVYDGDGLHIDEHEVAAGHGAVVHCDRAVRLRGGDAGAEVVMLQGRPIGEPVAKYGPFVLNDRAGIEQAFRDYQETGFGGWPWGSDEPVHDRDAGRFARHGDGTREDL